MASGGWEWPGFYWDQELYPEGRSGDQRAIGSYARCSIPACARMVPNQELREHAIRGHLPRFFFFGTPTQVSAAMPILANAMVSHGGVRELYNLTRAEYFIPAYHFVYPEEDYFFRAMARHWGDECPEHFCLYPPNSIALVTHWAVLMELLFLAGARMQRMFRDFDMQRGGTLSSSVYPGPPVWPEPLDPFRLAYEGVRRVERGSYEGPPAEPVPRCVRPPPVSRGQGRLKEAIMTGP